MNGTVVFTGGGTGGHVFPGIAVLEKLRAGFAGRIVWIGSKAGMEKNIVEGKRIEFLGIPSGKLRRYVSLRNVLDIAKVFLGCVSAFSIIRKLRPCLLFSKGGYVSVPPVIAAKLLKVPIVIHESDVDPGLATRICTKFAHTICVSYEDSKSYFPPEYIGKLFVTGNPIRDDIYRGSREAGRKRFSIPDEAPVLLVLGGSQGSVQINKAIEEVVDTLLETWYVIHQTGAYNYKQSLDARYITAPFFNDEYPDILAASDVVVSRAGAGALWEIAARGLPSILIPLGSAGSRGDQIKNAELFARKGASVVLPSDGLTGAHIRTALTELLSDAKKRQSMAEAARKIGGTAKASETIADLLLKIIGEDRA